MYPRGARLMKRLLKEFNHRDAWRWFDAEGVKLVTQDDQCVFPVSQDAMEIVGTLRRLARETGVEVRTESRVGKIESDPSTGRFTITMEAEGDISASADVVVVTTGGSPKTSGLSFLDALGLDMEEPVPSLFSLCVPQQGLTKLTGTVINEASVGIAGTKFRASGPLLITHWGVSGPAVLRLSSYAARHLSEREYKCDLLINWLGTGNDAASTARMITEMAVMNGQKQVSSVRPEGLNGRLWRHILERAGLRLDARWAELGGKGLNRLASTLTCDTYRVDGKNRFKDEFVTCGGVALSNVNPSTLESRKHPGLYFAGEVLDVDAVTGGFNLQAAWTMGYVVAKSVAARMNV